jgi:pyruvyltransferase
MFDIITTCLDKVNIYNRRICGALGIVSRANFFAWRPPKGHKIQINFGDELFRMITTRIAASEVDWCDSPSAFRRKILVGGSAIEFARDYDIIWGAGIRNINQKKYFKTIDVRAVRGPLTKEFFDNNMIPCPNIFGDPALLLPTLFPEFSRNTVSGLIGYIPHFTDEIPVECHKKVKIISPSRFPEIVISEILQCEFIISGSLHGIIVAEAYGIPAVWLKISKTEPMLKYFVYYLSTNRSPLMAQNLPEAIKLLTMVKDKPVNVPDPVLLLEAFPIDVCGRKH